MTMLLNNNIGEVLRLNRIKCGMTRKRMCRQLFSHHAEELAPAQLRRYEDGKTAVPAALLYQLASIMSIDITRFFESPDAAILLNKRTQRLMEAYLQITPQAAQDNLLCLMRHLVRE